MIRVIGNDYATSQVDVQVGRNGHVRRIDDIHVYREGTKMSRRIAVAFRQDGKRTTLTMTPDRAAELIAALTAISNEGEP